MDVSGVVRQRIEQITDRVAPETADREVMFDNIGLFVAGGVFDPSKGRSARRMWAAIAAFPPGQGDRVLEIGTGSGLLSIRAHQFSQAPVTAVDIMPDAIRSAGQNFLRHGVSAEVTVSDMFAAVKGRRFDYVIFNAPTAHPSVQADNKGAVTLWDVSGQLKQRFVEGVAEHLDPANPQARAVMMYSLYADYDAVTPIDFARHGLVGTRELVEKDDISETGVMVIRRAASPRIS